MSIQFNLNTQKAVEAVLWVIRRGETNLYNIVKIMFESDKFHLNNYGRPVTGDRYVAMEHGTVPSWIFDATKLERGNIGFARVKNTLVGEREPNMDYLSESDVEALEVGYAKYSGKSFSAVEQLNHKEEAWKKAYENKPETASCAPILFEDMIDDPELKAHLELYASSVVM